MTELEKAIDRFERAARRLALANTNFAAGIPHKDLEREKQAAYQKLLRVATRPTIS